MGIDCRKVERMVKGFANHNRIKILELLAGEPELSVLEVADRLKIGYENASDHIRKMSSAGLLMKRSSGPFVLHKLTPRAEGILAFCKKLQ